MASVMHQFAKAAHLDWIGKLFNRKRNLSPAQKMQLTSWRDMPRASLDASLESSRFVVIDVESSGLNLSLDHLIAIGAVAVTNGKIDVADSFEVVLQQAESSSHENILIHGISRSAQRNGVPPAEALLLFLQYLQKTPLVAFHVTFDETMIRRAMKQFLGLNFRHDWLDLAYVMPGLYPEKSKSLRLLDQWHRYFDIRNPARHNAVADAVSTAQLFLVAARKARERRIVTYQGLRHVEKAQRWVSWQQT